MKKYHARYTVALSFFVLFIASFNQTAQSATTPAGQDKLRVTTGEPKRNGDSLFSYTVEWRIDEGVISRATGIFFIKGPDRLKPTSDIDVAKKMVSSLNDGMEQQYPSWRGVLARNIQGEPEITLVNKSGFSFTTLTIRDYSNQKMTFDQVDKTFAAAGIDVAIDLVLTSNVDYIEGFTTYDPAKNSAHQGSIEIRIDDSKPVVIQTNDKTTAQLEQEIASALSSAKFSTEPLFPNLMDSDNRNNKPFDGGEVQFTTLAARTITMNINDPTLGALTKFKYQDNNQSTDAFNPMTMIILLGLAIVGFFGYNTYQARKQHNDANNQGN